MISNKNTRSFPFLFLLAFVGLIINKQADGSSTNNSILANRINVSEERQGEIQKFLRGENDDPVTKFINEFNNIADAINQGDISDVDSSSSINADEERSDALVGIIMNANGITGGVEQAEDIFNSIATAGISNKEENNDVVAGEQIKNIDNDNNNPAYSFLDLFNNIADGINDALSTDGIEDIVSLLDIVSSVLDVVSLTGIPQVLAAKLIIDAITGIANFILDNNNNNDPEVLLLEEDDAARDDNNDSVVSTVDASETNPLTSMFTPLTEIVTQMVTNAKNSFTEFTTNFGF